MFELFGLLIAGAAAATGYIKTRDFVRRRLRFVDAVQRGSAPILAGGVAAVAAAPVVWVLPLVGAGTALLFGISVGAGVRAGSRDIRRLLRG